MAKTESERSSLLFVLPVLALWLVPVITFAFLFPNAHSVERQSVRQSEPTTTVIGSRLDDSRQAVDAEVKLLAAPTVNSRASGLVTGVEVGVGTEIVSGTVLMRVDGVAVIAYSAGAPLFRDLRLGDQGGDVVDLTTFLASVNLLKPTNQGSKYTRAVANGVEGLQKILGAPADGNFRTSYMAFMPAPTLVIASMNVEVDESVTSGQAILSAVSEPSSLSFTVTGSSNKPPRSSDGPLILTAGEHQVEIATLNLSAEERADVYLALEAGASAGAVTANRPEGESRVVFSGALLASAKPLRVGVAPNSALYISKSSTPCVFVNAGSKSTSKFEAVPVQDTQLLVGELGEVTVPSSLVGKSVARDPLTLSETTLSRCK